MPALIGGAVWIPLGGKKRPIHGWVLVDEADAEWAASYSWYRARDGYVYRNKSRMDTGDGPKHIAMHRELAGTGATQVTDHINRDRADNRRSNLRVLEDQGQNLHNQSKRRETTRTVTSKHRGVSYWQDRHGYAYWRARVTVAGKEKTRYFKTEDEAIAGARALRTELMAFAVES